jgi:hypothetical protein
MAPGALPHLSRVPKQRLLSPKIHRWRRQSCGTLLEISLIPLEFFRWEATYRRRGVVRRRPGGPHHRWARPVPGPRPSWCVQPLAPLRLSFGLRSSSGKNRSSGTCFVQFREYFLCSFSETQKQQKIGNWHCGILSIG